VWDAAEFRLLRKFTLTKDSLVHSYAFSPDARVLFCIGADKALYASELASGTGFILVGPETLNGGAMSLSKFGKYMLSHERRGEILLWNLGKLSGEPTALSAAEATNAWELLADDNVKLAQAAIRDLSASGKIALRIIREQVKPEIQIDERKIAQLIDDLVSPDFPTRKRAAEALIACGVVAEKALRSALAKDAPLELQRTGAEILVHIGQQTLTGRPLQSVRAIEILERIGTPEAVAVLETLSKGERRAFQTKAALWALERLKKSSER
jgi:hypothetical protein